MTELNNMEKMKELELLRAKIYDLPIEHQEQEKLMQLTYDLEASISTLIQESNREAVEKYNEKIFFGDTISVDRKIYISMEHIQEAKKAYLSSIGKEESVKPIRRNYKNTK